MILTNKALWIIERNLSDFLTLAGIAEACGVSKHHLAHAFGTDAGLSVMQYVRSRRLTAAAIALSEGRDDILDLALEIGYGSHEAFSRAFKTQFGVTPETVRRNQSINNLPMVNAMKLQNDTAAALDPHRISDHGPMLLVGLCERHSFKQTQHIAAQWQRFMGAYGEIPDRLDSIPIGVAANMDDDGNFDYVCAAEVTKFSKTPKGLIQMQIPAQTYAVFTHRAHVSMIPATYSAIWNHWFPTQQRKPVEAPSFERHLPTFDPRTGLGGVEIWIPVGEN
jgi:AraC family transcriptional regulator